MIKYTMHAMRWWMKLFEASMLEPDAIAAFKKLGDLQRGAPEAAMLAVQYANGGGVLNPVVEHIGDITYRMSHVADFGRAEGYEKVVKTYRWLTHPYGFAKEFNENLRNNARYRKVPFNQLRTKVAQLLDRYANEHAKLPVYNRAQWLARQAAIHVGHQEWGEPADTLHQLLQMAPDEDAWEQVSFETHRDPTGHLMQWSPSMAMQPA
jgi:hypothetical protein